MHSKLSPVSLEGRLYGTHDVLVRCMWSVLENEQKQRLRLSSKALLGDVDGMVSQAGMPQDVKAEMSLSMLDVKRAFARWANVEELEVPRVTDGAVMAAHAADQLPCLQSIALTWLWGYTAKELVEMAGPLLTSVTVTPNDFEEYVVKDKGENYGGGPLNSDEDEGDNDEGPWDPVFGEGFGVFEKCPRLKNLDIEDCNACYYPSLAPLSRVPSLESLTLHECKWVNMGELKGCTQLRSLRVVINKAMLPFDELAPLTRLNSFTMGATKVRSLDFLSSWTNLEELGIEINPISDFSPLASLTKLRKLDLDYSARNERLLVEQGVISKATHPLLSITLPEHNDKDAEDEDEDWDDETDEDESQYWDDEDDMGDDWHDDFCLNRYFDEIDVEKENLLAAVSTLKEIAIAGYRSKV